MATKRTRTDRPRLSKDDRRDLRIIKNWVAEQLRTPMGVCKLLEGFDKKDLPKDVGLAASLMHERMHFDRMNRPSSGAYKLAHAYGRFG